MKIQISDNISQNIQDIVFETGETSNSVLLQSILLMAHPVGSYYWSSDSTSPETLFGGTWEQVKDKFILAAGSSYTTIGGTGGSANTTLAETNIPSHRHSFSATSGNQSADHTHSVSGTSGNQSANHTHSGTTGNQSANHTHSVTIAANGDHRHQTYKSWGLNTGSGALNYVTGTVDDGLSGSGNYSGYAGSHGHSVTVGNNSANHTHSITTGNQSASHNHSISITSKGQSANHTHSVSGNTGYTGSATAFSNMPPYQIAYCWRRTA